MNINKKNQIYFIRKIGSIKEYKLENGLKILLINDPSQESITINITYLVGSRHEGGNEAGMAHLLEHMLFKGSLNFKDIKGSLHDKGAFYNASTWFDRTNYYETLSANIENLKFALHLEADRMINSFISQKDLDIEMSVVRNEFEIGENDTINVLHDQIMSAAFRWHNYGKATIGNKSSIEHITANDLRKFYKHYYQPDNAVLILNGNLKEKYSLELVEKYFGKINKPKRILNKIYNEEPIQEGTRNIIISRSGDVATAAIAYHIPSGCNSDFATIKIIIDLLTNEPNGVLYKNLIKNKKATEIYGIAYALYDPSVLMILAQAINPLKVNTLKTKLISEIKNFDNYISEEHVKKSKLRLIKNIKLTEANSKKFTLCLSDFIGQGDYRLFFLIKDFLKKTKLNDVIRVAKKYLIISNMTSGVFIPKQNLKRANIPTKKNLEKTFKNYSNSEKLIKGKSFESTPENIDKNTRNIYLLNNIKLALLIKHTRANIVNAKFNFRFSNEHSLYKYVEENSFLPEFLMRGTKKKTYEKIQDELDLLESTLNIYSDLGIISANITSNKKYFHKVVKLLSEIIIKPCFCEKEFSLLQQKKISEITESLSDPECLCFNTLDRLKNPWLKNSIHYIPTLSEKIKFLKNLSNEKVCNFYKSNLGASNLEISIVGNINESKTIVLLNKCFGNFKSPKLYSRIKSTFIGVNCKTEEIKTPDKQMAIAALSTRIKMKDDDEDYPALRIAHYIFSESMKSRLIYRLREKEGLSYNVGGLLIASKFEQNTSILMYSMFRNILLSSRLLLGFISLSESA